MVNEKSRYDPLQGNLVSLPLGISDQVVTEELAAQLTEELEHVLSQLDSAEADRRIGQYVAETVARVVRGLPTEHRAQRAAELANQVIALLAAEVERVDLGPGDRLQIPPERHLASYKSGLGVGEPQRPVTPLSDTVLFTNASAEPSLASEIARELASADQVDALIAFVKWSGLRLIADQVSAHLQAGKPLRVITTTYIGATDRRAIDWLVEQGAEVKVAYDDKATRLHAKAWLFRRDTGFDTAWIGSSNLSRPALVDGLEWNVRASRVSTPDVIDKFSATFDSYWSDVHFETYDPGRDADRFDTAIGSARGTASAIDLSFVDIHPYAFQRQMLEDLDTERHRHGRWRNLVVAATGTGKTVVSALDYRRLRDQLERSRLLFVAHRREILEQSLLTFRMVLRDQTFGELYVDGARPERWDHVFASVQSLTAYGPTRVPADHFDVVIVDEFHHAAASTYKALLEHLAPRVLVGLTATPERADGQSILGWFGDRIAVELRLWEAIDSGHLVPFHYFGVHDGTDLSGLEWTRGGYQISQLENVYTGHDARVAIVLEAIRDTVTDPQSMRALGFCVSIAHAEYMALRFTEAGIPAVAVTANTAAEERAGALRRLRDGDLAVVFAVDLFNEGVDVPDIDTVLFLRPTESLTVFLQQLGRGLRRADNKAVLTVLDFVGNQHRKFRFDLRYRALTGDSRQGILDQINDGFPFLPSGCHIELDRVARQIVLDHIKDSLPTRWLDRVAELRTLGDVGLGDYLAETGLELPDIYTGGKSWTSHRRAAGTLPGSEGEYESVLSRALGRTLHIDDERRIDFYSQLLDQANLSAEPTSESERRLMFMLHTVLWDREKLSIREGMERLGSEEPIREELLQLLEILDQQAAHVSMPLDDVSPLRIHGRYSLAEIMAGMGIGSPERPLRPQAGVYWDEKSASDLFFVTLEKSEKDFSPTTRYRDYAISPTLFHWESQSVTRADSGTGQRYINHDREGSRVLIFARERKEDQRRTMPYLFLGPATYVRHQRERPMQIVWRLHHEIPADFYHHAAVAAG